MRRELPLAVATGILIAFAMPPFPTGFLAYFALIPFFYLLENKRIWEAFRWGYVTGLCVYFTSLFWIGWVTLPGLIGVLLVMPLYLALYAVLHVVFVRQLSSFAYLVVPFLWTAVEYLQSFAETAFPWIYLGYTQTYYLAFIQWAEYGAVYGITLWVVTLNVLFYYLIRFASTPASRRGIVISLLLCVLVPAVHGMRTLRTGADDRSIKVAMIQGNIDPFAKWQKGTVESQFEQYQTMTREAIDSEPDLVIWPETAVPFFLRYEPDYIDKIRNLVDSARVPLLTGMLDFEYDVDGASRHFNAAALFEPYNGAIQRYAKMQLVPFSERVPYRQFAPIAAFKDFLKRLNLGVGDFSRGGDYKVFTFKPRQVYIEEAGTGREGVRGLIHLAVPICYESVFPAINRRFIERGANLLAVITNDAWFGKTTAPYQHARIAVFRAIENRVAIARCANTGITCFIDRFGRLSNASPLFEQAIVCGEVALRAKETFYTRHGDWLAIAALVVTLAAVPVAVARALQNRESI